MCFGMAVTRQGCGSGSSSRSNSKPGDAELRELLVVELLKVILEDMPEMFGKVKEGLIEMMDERIQTLRAELAVGQFMAHNLIFLDYRACGGPMFFRKKDPISNMH